MKKVLIIMMAVLLIGALFISCSNEVEKDTLGKVSISFDDSRSIKTSVTSSVKSVNELVWFYTATKTSGLYATGQTSSLTIVPAYDNNSTAGKLTTGTSLGDFSTGNWKFSFYGFNEAADSSDLTKAVYYSIDIPVRVEGEGQVAVRIVLSEGEVDLGKVVFDDLSIDLNAFNGLLRTGGTLSLDIFMNDETAAGKVATMSGGSVTTAAVYNLTPAAEKTNLQAGTYEFIFVLNYTTDEGLETEETVEVARESKTVVIANGTIITFSGDILKTNTLKNVVIGDITEGENKAQASFVGEVPTEQTTVSVAVSPASASDTSETIANTKVTFPENVLATAVNNAVDNQNEELTSSKVTIEVTSTLEATTKFEIKATSDSNAFAGINLDLWKTTTQENVETTAKIDNPTFTSPVTVETYIAKGLTGVTVEYQGDSELSHPVASNDQAKSEAQQADEYDTDAELGDKLGYSRESGLLRFTTTHFSEFAVGADQNVYDKSNNTAYKLSELTPGMMDKTHEYVLLDSKLANTVPDAIDNFNAGYKWSAIHPAGENPNTEDFAGGYGTKIEPYLIDDYDTMQNITTVSKQKARAQAVVNASGTALDYNYYAGFYGSYHAAFSGYSTYDEYFETEWLPYKSYADKPDSFDPSPYYFMVKEGITEIDCGEGGRDWSRVTMYGSFNGNKVSFTNLNGSLFASVASSESAVVLSNFTVNASPDKIFGAHAAPVVQWTESSIKFNKVNVAGTIIGYSVASYVGQCYSEKNNPIKLTFNDCISSAYIIGYGEYAAGFIGYSNLGAAYDGSSPIDLELNNSYFNGTLYSSADYYYSWGNNTGWFSSFADNSENKSEYVSSTWNGNTKQLIGGSYIVENGSKALISTNADSSTISVGDQFSIDAKTGSVVCDVLMIVGPNDSNGKGNFTGLYYRETLSPSDGKFTSEEIKRFNVHINDSTHPVDGIDGNDFYITHGQGGTTYGSYLVYFVEFSDTSRTNCVGVTRYNLM